MSDSLGTPARTFPLHDVTLWVSTNWIYLVPIGCTLCLCVGCGWFLLCALPRRSRKRQLKTQVLAKTRATTISTTTRIRTAPSPIEDLRSASVAALRSARDRLSAGFASQVTPPSAQPSAPGSNTAGSSIACAARGQARRHRGPARPRSPVAAAPIPSIYTREASRRRRRRAGARGHLARARVYGSGSPEAQGLLRDPDPEAEKTKQETDATNKRSIYNVPAACMTQATTFEADARLSQTTHAFIVARETLFTTAGFSCCRRHVQVVRRASSVTE